MTTNDHPAPLPVAMTDDPRQRAHEFGPPSPARRRFLARLSLGLGALGGAIVGVPVIGFLLAPLFRRQPQIWTTVGSIDQFRVGETTQVVLVDPSPLAWAGLASRVAVWLRRQTEQEFIAFSVNCTHLGCPVRWLPTARIFLCPCHGGVFYADGRVAGGPPQRPLVRYPVRARGGQIQVLSGVSPIDDDRE